MTLLFGNVLKVKVPAGDKIFFNSLPGIIGSKKKLEEKTMADEEFKRELKNVNILNNTFPVFSKPMFKRYLKKHGLEHIEGIINQTSEELNDILSMELLNHIKQMKSNRMGEFEGIKREEHKKPKDIGIKSSPSWLKRRYFFNDEDDINNKLKNEYDSNK